jgi:hypothetical protein
MSTTYDSADELAQALRRAATAHGEHEKELGHEDADWPSWYADHMVREQRFGHLPGRVDPKDLTTAHDTSRPQEVNTDPEQDFMLRYSGD